MYIKYIKNDSYKNLFFIFLLFNAVTAKLDRKALPKKKKKKRKRKTVVNFFQREVFGDKTTFNFHLFNIFSDFVTTQYTTAMFCLFI